MRGKARTRLAAAAAGLTIMLAAATGAANSSFTPWIHSLVQEGQSVRLTIQVFEDATEELVYDTFEFPGLDEAYSVTRWGTGQAETVVDGYLFDPAAALVVSDYVCHGDDGTETACTEDCGTFCAVAYRYEFVDECVPAGQQFYVVNVPAIEADPTWSDEGLGMQDIDVDDYPGDSCFDDDTGVCTVVAPGRPQGAAIAIFALLLGALLARRWRR
jgi:hypothetical protein